MWNVTLPWSHHTSLIIHLRFSYLFSDIFNIQLLPSFIILFTSCSLAIWIILATTMKSRALCKNGAFSINHSTLIQPYKSQFQQTFRLWFLCLSVHGTCLLLCWVFVCFVLLFFCLLYMVCKVPLWIRVTMVIGIISLFPGILVSVALWHISKTYNWIYFDQFHRFFRKLSIVPVNPFWFEADFWLFWVCVRALCNGWKYLSTQELKHLY